MKSMRLKAQPTPTNRPLNYNVVVEEYLEIHDLPISTSLMLGL